jgi:nodulation protein F
MWDEFEQTLRRHLPHLADDEPLRPDAELRDYGLDSMAAVELLAALEKHFGVRFRNEALNLENFRTPSTLWSALSTSLDPSAPATAG